MKILGSYRGFPTVIGSDNWTNFVGAEKELRDIIEHWNKNEIEKSMIPDDVEWKFDLPFASHFVVIWELQTRTIIKDLNALMNEKHLHLDDDRLDILLCEIKPILNRHPITPLSDVSNDFYPMILIWEWFFLQDYLIKMIFIFSDDWKQIQYLVDLFRTRGRKEYVFLFQERQKWTINRRSLVKGDLILLTNQHIPRNQWSLVRVVKTYTDECGDFRTVQVKVSKVKGEMKNKSVIFKRPISIFGNVIFKLL